MGSQLGAKWTVCLCGLSSLLLLDTEDYSARIDQESDQLGRRRSLMPLRGLCDKSTIDIGYHDGHDYSTSRSRRDDNDHGPRFHGHVCGKVSLKIRFLRPLVMFGGYCHGTVRYRLFTPGNIADQNKVCVYLGIEEIAMQCKCPF